MTKRLRVKLSARAEEDLIDIWLAIAADNPVNADRFLDRLNERADTLVDYPERGMARPNLGKGIRKLVEGNYLIVYRLENQAVSVIRIIHAARDLRNLILD